MYYPEDHREFMSFERDASAEEDVGVMTFVVLGKQFDFVWDSDEEEWVPRGLVEQAERSFWKGLCVGIVAGMLMAVLVVVGMRLG